MGYGHFLYLTGDKGNIKLQRHFSKSTSDIRTPCQGPRLCEFMLPPLWSPSIGLEYQRPCSEGVESLFGEPHCDSCGWPQHPSSGNPHKYLSVGHKHSIIHGSLEEGYMSVLHFLSEGKQINIFDKSQWLPHRQQGSGLVFRWVLEHHLITRDTAYQEAYIPGLHPHSSLFGGGSFSGR